MYPHCGTKSKTASIKGSIIFTMYNQFLRIDSKLSTVHCTKSQRGHQIHANPSPARGGGSAITHRHRACTNMLPGRKVRPQGRWNGTQSLQTNKTLTLTSLWHMMWDNKWGSKYTPSWPVMVQSIFPPPTLLGQWPSFLFSPCNWFPQLWGH